MQNCRPCKIPLDPGTANEFYLENTELLAPDNVKKYQQILGSLIYLSTMTRPDLTFATSLLSRFLAKPRHVHMLGAKHVLRYLKGTTDFSISYFKNSANDFPLTYVDASLGDAKIPAILLQGTKVIILEVQLFGTAGNKLLLQLPLCILSILLLHRVYINNVAKKF
mmetsp:Transcript_121915/g.182017  ORF Transcript_121915/g.182017 Transcript_121915/m.182017 type:complete len:166 (+) Transcript_121915:1704-2201(+)